MVVPGWWRGGTSVADCDQRSRSDYLGRDVWTTAPGGRGCTGAEPYAGWHRRIPRGAVSARRKDSPNEQCSRWLHCWQGWSAGRCLRFGDDGTPSRVRSSTGCEVVSTREPSGRVKPRSAARPRAQVGRPAPWGCGGTPPPDPPTHRHLDRLRRSAPRTPSAGADSLGSTAGDPVGRGVRSHVCFRARGSSRIREVRETAGNLELRRRVWNWQVGLSFPLAWRRTARPVTAT